MSRGDWKRVSRARPCPVCERPDWCLYAGDDNAPSAAICARVESDKLAGDQGAGWLHVLRNDGPSWPGWKRTVRVAARGLGPEPAANSHWRKRGLSDGTRRLETSFPTAALPGLRTAALVPLGLTREL